MKMGGHHIPKILNIHEPLFISSKNFDGSKDLPCHRILPQIYQHNDQLSYQLMHLDHLQAPPGKHKRH